MLTLSVHHPRIILSVSDSLAKSGPDCIHRFNCAPKAPTPSATLSTWPIKQSRLDLVLVLIASVPRPVAAIALTDTSPLHPFKCPFDVRIYSALTAIDFLQLTTSAGQVTSLQLAATLGGEFRLISFNKSDICCQSTERRVR